MRTRVQKAFIGRSKGYFQPICSISAALRTRSAACRFSAWCCGLNDIGMVMTRGCVVSQARAICCGVTPRAWAIACQGLVALDVPALHRAVGSQQDVVLLAVFQHPVFHVGPVRHAVGNLVGEQRGLAKRSGLFEQLQVEIADSQVPHLALLHQLVERAEGLRQLHAHSRPVDQVQVEIVHAQAAQAVLAGAQHILVLQMLGGDLGGDEERLARHAVFRGWP